jgi:hypothetical protein
MNWLKDFFFCNTWREFFVAIVVLGQWDSSCSGRCWCLCL